MKEVQSHVVTESSTAALGREKQPRDCRYTAPVEKGPGLRSRLSLSHQLMEESLSRSRRGSGSLLHPSNCAAHSKYMSTKLLTTSQSWIIRCGPRIPMVRHIFCASVSHLAHWSVVAPQEFLQKDDKNNFVSRYGQAWSGAEGRRGIHDLGGWQHLYAFPSPESKPGHQPAGKTLTAVNRIEKQQLRVTKIELCLESCGICRLRK